MTCYAADNDASLWLLLHLIINEITIARDVMSESVGKDLLLFFSKFIIYLPNWWFSVGLII